MVGYRQLIMRQNVLWYLTNIEDFYPSRYDQQLRDTLSAYALHVRNLAGDRDAGYRRPLRLPSRAARKFPAASA